MAVARALGARRVIAVDIAKPRLEFAKGYAATDVFSPPERNKEESQIDYSRRSAEEMRKELGIAERGPEAVDVIIEATGAPVCVQTGIFLVKPAGTCVQVNDHWKLVMPFVLIAFVSIVGRNGCVRSDHTDHYRIGEGDHPQKLLPVSNILPLFDYRC